MEKTKKIYKFFVLFLLIFISVCLFSFNVVAASNQYSTEGKWTEGGVTENLVALTKGKLTDQGWNINKDQVKETAVTTTAGKVTDEFGKVDGNGNDILGIQALASSDDIGNKDYSNGVWKRIMLSEADIEKAKKGDLTITASAGYYEQATASHYCSVQIFFEKEIGDEISNIGTKQKISRSGQILSVTGKVPAGTTSFRYYVSNWGSLAARPFISLINCTLSDKTAPKISSITFDNSNITDKENNVAVNGNELIYDVNFDEKVEIVKTNTYTGIGILKFDGKTSSKRTSEPTIIHENGKSKVRYIFALPDLYTSGKLYLASINNLKVVDEANNATIINKDVTSEKIQYYRDMSIYTNNIKDLSYSVPGKATYNTDATIKLKTVNGYNLPSIVKIYVGSSLLKSTQYTYDKTTGIIVVSGKAITNDIKIYANGVPKDLTITFDKKGGINGTDSIKATYLSSMPQITIPTKKGYTFLGYFEKENGQGRKYYKADGTSATTCYKYDDITLYAAWEANTYEVI